MSYLLKQLDKKQIQKQVEKALQEKLVKQKTHRKKSLNFRYTIERLKLFHTEMYEMMSAINTQKLSITDGNTQMLFSIHDPITVLILQTGENNSWETSFIIEADSSVKEVLTAKIKMGLEFESTHLDIASFGQGVQKFLKTIETKC